MLMSNWYMINTFVSNLGTATYYFFFVICKLLLLLYLLYTLQKKTTYTHKHTGKYNTNRL